MQVLVIGQRRCNGGVFVAERGRKSNKSEKKVSLSHIQAMYNSVERDILSRKKDMLARTYVFLLNDDFLSNVPSPLRVNLLTLLMIFCLLPFFYHQLLRLPHEQYVLPNLQLRCRRAVKELSSAIVHDVRLKRCFFSSTLILGAILHRLLDLCVPQEQMHSNAKLR